MTDETQKFQNIKKKIANEIFVSENQKEISRMLFGLRVWFRQVSLYLKH